MTYFFTVRNTQRYGVRPSLFWSRIPGALDISGSHHHRIDRSEEFVDEKSHSW